MNLIRYIVDENGTKNWDRTMWIEYGPAPHGKQQQNDEKRAENTCCYCIVMKITWKLYEPNITVRDRIFLKDVNWTLQRIEHHSLIIFIQKSNSGSSQCTTSLCFKSEQWISIMIQKLYEPSANITLPKTRLTDLTRRLLLHNRLPQYNLIVNTLNKQTNNSIRKDPHNMHDIRIPTKSKF